MQVNIPAWSSGLYLYGSRVIRGSGEYSNPCYIRYPIQNRCGGLLGAFEGYALLPVLANTSTVKPFLRLRRKKYARFFLADVAQLTYLTSRDPRLPGGSSAKPGWGGSVRSPRRPVVSGH